MSYMWNIAVKVLILQDIRSLVSNMLQIYRVSQKNRGVFAKFY